MVTYADDTEKSYCRFFSRMPLPSLIEDQGSIEKILDSAVGGSLRGAGTESATQEKITLNGHPGREIVSTRAASGSSPPIVLTSRFYLANDTLVTLTVVRAEVDRYDVEVDKFLESLRLER